MPINTITAAGKSRLQQQMKINVAMYCRSNTDVLVVYRKSIVTSDMESMKGGEEVSKRKKKIIVREKLMPMMKRSRKTKTKRDSNPRIEISNQNL
jgi:hypothetical protein